MNKKSENSGTIGAARTVLVFHEGDSPKAVVTNILARRRKTAAKTRIRFQGPSIFSKNVAAHIRKIVWPVAEAVLSRLTDQSYGFDLSVSNLSAASSREVAVNISGFSADAAILVAILSAGTGIPVTENLVFTGHIAGPDGSIRMISGIPEKAEAVINAPNADTLVYPDIGGDLSMKALSPQETERIEGALGQAKDRICLAAVRDVSDLVEIAFSERDLLAASLKEDFFYLKELRLESGDPVGRAVHHLANDLERRFWSQLHADFSPGQSRKAVSLLSEFADSCIRKESYPSQTGQNLYRVIASLPPDIRRLKLRVPTAAGIKVCGVLPFCRKIAKRRRLAVSQGMFRRDQSTIGALSRQVLKRVQKIREPDRIAGNPHFRNRRRPHRFGNHGQDRQRPRLLCNGKRRFLFPRTFLRTHRLLFHPPVKASSRFHRTCGHGRGRSRWA